jgi:hypothetical protein
MWMSATQRTGTKRNKSFRTSKVAWRTNKAGEGLICVETILLEGFLLVCRISGLYVIVFVKSNYLTIFLFWRIVEHIFCKL